MWLTLDAFIKDEQRARGARTTHKQNWHHMPIAHNKIGPYLPMTTVATSGGLFDTAAVVSRLQSAWLLMWQMEVRREWDGDLHDAALRS